jgi:hypothetical protein
MSMSAFQAYAGAYDFDGGSYSWRCYATARVYAIRKSEHTPFPTAPEGLKWVTPARQEQQVDCLVEDGVGEFSQILLQVQAQPEASLAPQTRQRAEAASATA